MWGIKTQNKLPEPFLMELDKSGTHQPKLHSKLILKSPRFVQFGANLAMFETKSDIPDISFGEDVTYWVATNCRQENLNIICTYSLDWLVSFQIRQCYKTINLFKK